MANVEHRRKDTMNAADFEEEFKTTPGRTPRMPETPETPWTRPTRKADFFALSPVEESFFFFSAAAVVFVASSSSSKQRLLLFFEMGFWWSSSSLFGSPSSAIISALSPQKSSSSSSSSRRSHSPPRLLLWCTCGSLLACISSCSFEPDVTTFLAPNTVGSISKTTSSPACAFSSPSPSALSSLTCSFSAFSRSRNFFAPRAAANATQSIVNPTILSPTSPIALTFNSRFNAKKRQTRKERPRECPTAQENPRRMFSLLPLLLLRLSSSETKEEEEVALSSSFSSSSSYSSALRRSSIAKALSSSSSSSSELEIGDDFSDDAFVVVVVVDEEEEAITASAMTWSGPDKTCARPNAKPNAIKDGNDAFSSNEEEETIICLSDARSLRKERKGGFLCNGQC